jgi:hypothetical protein
VNISKVSCENLKRMAKLPGVETALMPPQRAVSLLNPLTRNGFMYVSSLHF